ncbi:hypothetical protein B0H14DRAFT_3641407 [Mycena olivaceomarginata]|nr:hypothetical protein B0H14DRAFT_3641407 [Mycena olivaceomarginata]
MWSRTPAVTDTTEELEEEDVLMPETPTSPSSASVEPDAWRKVTKNKIMAVGQILRVFTLLREESEKVSELKSILGSSKLPYGSLAFGSDGIKNAITGFDDARMSDIENKRLPPELVDAESAKSKAFTSSCSSVSSSGASSLMPTTPNDEAPAQVALGIGPQCHYTRQERAGARHGRVARQRLALPLPLGLAVGQPVDAIPVQTRAAGECGGSSSLPDMARERLGRLACWETPSGRDGPKLFIHGALLATDSCHHPTILDSHGAYLAHGAGLAPYRTLVPQFSYSVTPLHTDVRVALPLNWVPDDIPNEGRPPPLRLAWAKRVDARLQWCSSDTGIWHASDRHWRQAHRIRLAALGADVGNMNASVLDPGVPDTLSDVTGGSVGSRAQRGVGEDPDGAEFDLDEDDNGEEDGHAARPVGLVLPVLHTRLVPALFDVAFSGNPMNCEPTAARYKYVIDVDGNKWLSRFKRLTNSGSLIFKATTYLEWFTERLAP